MSAGSPEGATRSPHAERAHHSHFAPAANGLATTAGPEFSGTRHQHVGWSKKKQYPRPATSLEWSVEPPSRAASEWSEAWTATIKVKPKQPHMEEETTLFVVNPGRFHLATCDVTSPRLTRRAFGLTTKEFYAIVEPVKDAPPEREAMLVIRHGPNARTRGKYDSRTCQLGFGIVEVSPPPSSFHLLPHKHLCRWWCNSESCASAGPLSHFSQCEHSWITY